MKTICIAGNLGKDAELKSANGKDFCSFSVAVADGWGDKKTTVWFDVTRWGNGASGLTGILSKGSRVAVSGELSTREHNGKTYLQVRADNVTVLSSSQGGNTTRREPDGSRGAPATESNGWGDDLDDSIPFISNAGIF